MKDANFTTVFDITRSGFRDWTFPAFGLIFIALGTGLFLWPKIATAMNLPCLDRPSKFKKFFRYYFLGFSIFWTFTAFMATYVPYRRHRQLAESRTCSTIEGAVQNFRPMPLAGHAMEEFTVNGTRFSYSDYEISDSFNTTASCGGPMRENSYVRLCYDPTGNKILKLEIRDFAGP